MKTFQLLLILLFCFIQSIGFAQIGKVINARTGLPISNAGIRIVINTDDGKVFDTGARSDLQGYFEIPGIETGKGIGLGLLIKIKDYEPKFVIFENKGFTIGDDIKLTPIKKTYNLELYNYNSNKALPLLVLQTPFPDSTIFFRKNTDTKYQVVTTKNFGEKLDLEIISGIERIKISTTFPESTNLPNLYINLEQEKKWLAWVWGIGTALTIGTAIYADIRSKNFYDDYDESRIKSDYDKANNWYHVAYVCCRASSASAAGFSYYMGKKHFRKKETPKAFFE